MKFYTKLVSLLLVLIMAISAVSCATESNPTETGSNTLPPIETGDDRLAASDGIEAVSYAGQQYKISISDNQQYEIFSEDTQETVGAAVFNRNLRVEAKYDIEIVPVITTGYSSGVGQLLHEEDVKRSISANDNAFDTVLMCAWRAGTLIVDGYFYDWYDDVPGVNFEQPWWNQRCNNAFTINDMLFAAVGDISLTTLAMAHCYLFNQTMATDKRLDDLYQTVRDKEWTIDYVQRISKDIYTDVNKNSQKDTEDIFGFASGIVTNLDAYLPSFGIQLVSSESDGELVISVDSNRDRVQTAVEKISDLFYNNGDSSYISMTHAEYADRYKMFANGQVLLIDATVNVLANQCRDMTDKYGVLPYPLFDENQEEYYSNAHDNFSVLTMANNVSGDRLEMVGKVTESLCCETYRTVITAYYETSMKDKYTSNLEEDSEMLDIIMAGRNYDLAVLFAPSLDRLFYFFRDMIAKQDTNVDGALDDRIFGWRASLMRLEGLYEKMAEDNA
ncbi:MAG: hypothetical protein E7618_02870 [Ruminococcaceae bacterium]|nr:hypothetical protein [Oscillospiraceae bacterium]